MQVNSIQFKSSQVKSSQVNSSQVNSIQVKSSQVKSIQFNSIQFNSIQVNESNSHEARLNRTSNTHFQRTPSTLPSNFKKLKKFSSTNNVKNCSSFFATHFQQTSILRETHLNVGWMSVDRSHITTFRTYSSRIHEGSVRSVHKHMQIHVINWTARYNTWNVCLLLIFIIDISAEHVLKNSHVYTTWILI